MVWTQQNIDRLNSKSDLIEIFQTELYQERVIKMKEHAQVFHTAHGVLKARILLKLFAIPFSSGPCFVRTLHHNPSVFSGPTWAIVSLS